MLSRDLVFLLLLAVAVSLSCLLTWTTRQFAKRWGLVRGPESARHIHQTPVPRIGGTAIVLTFFSIVIFGVAFRWLSNTPLGEFGELAALIPPLTLLYAVGLWDDLKSATPALKIAAQILGGAWLFFGGYRAFSVSPESSPLLFVLSFVTTVGWVLWISNAFNLIDGLDGLAAGSALFSLVTLLALGVISDNRQLIAGTIILGGAIIGFLRYNFNPATIFLGDCGSLAIGFLLSALSLSSHEAKSPTLVALAVPLVAFGLPILETVLSVVRRFLSGRPIFDADSEHIHHKLLMRGLSHRQVVIVLYGVSGLFAFLSIFLLYPGMTSFALVLGTVSALIFFGIQQLKYPELLELVRLAQRTIQQKKIIHNNVRIRKASEFLREANTREQISKALELAFGESDFDDLEVALYGPPHSDSADMILELDLRSESPFGRSRPKFSMQFALVHRDQVFGMLSLNRSRESEVMLDINLIITELQPALSEASFRLQSRRAVAHSSSLLARTHVVHSGG
jgi:UDP-GlcNAc:undecaprenyl-phosphate/decaprenyl-phosphate GlcNAc-1-phosphate transferase